MQNCQPCSAIVFLKLALCGYSQLWLQGFQLTLKKIQFLYFIRMRNYPVDDRTIWLAPKGAIFFCRFHFRFIIQPSSFHQAARPLIAYRGCFWGVWGLSVVYSAVVPGASLFFFHFTFALLICLSVFAIWKSVMQTKRLGVRHQGFPSHHWPQY